MNYLHQIIPSSRYLSWSSRRRFLGAVSFLWCLNKFSRLFFAELNFIYCFLSVALQRNVWMCLSRCVTSAKAFNACSTLSVVVNICFKIFQLLSSSSSMIFILIKLTKVLNKNKFIACDVLYTPILWSWTKKLYSFRVTSFKLFFLPLSAINIQFCLHLFTTLSSPQKTN